jgi:hypothetical protein
MTPQEIKAPAVGAAGASSKSHLRSKFSAMSSRTEAQRQRIIEALQRRPHSTEDLRCMGIFQAATRIKELRDRFGYAITTTLITLVDREGYTHPRAALYSLDKSSSSAAIGGGL